MYGVPPRDKVTTRRVVAKKSRRERIACLTAYDYTMARLLDEAGVDLVLVGDSVANVVHGMPNTLNIGLDEMVMHTRAVAAGVRRALVVADMPFMSYQVSVESAVANAGRLLQAGAEAVKVEGAGPIVPVATRLVELGIPVMGHIGLRPQSVHQLGGYRLQGRTPSERSQLLSEARELEQAGCFALVLEKIPAEAATDVTAAIGIPTIGIGAGPDCDGQVLVLNDMLGLTDAEPFRFVKRYASLWGSVGQAVTQYCEDVRSGRFPDDEHSFHADESR
jgi:3-methyl-2-oxobutanoate hydroxymethyltransferase